MRLFPLAIASIALPILAACNDNDGGSGPPPASADTITVSQVVSGLDHPLFLTAPAGDSSRLFVVEQTGRIRIIDHDTLLATPFLDLSGVVNSGGELGLLGMAFYPDYATSGRFIVSYTRQRAGSDTGGMSVLARYTVSADANVANPTADRELLTFDQPYDNHKGGMVAFGPDDFLYAGFGDGGSEGDPDHHGQDRTELLGSLIRLDVSGPGDYAIPPGNPYAGSDSLKPELWNYGLRNPWRFSFDRSTGDLYIGDVGQSNEEEIDVQAAGAAGGANYGWSEVEGDQCYTSGCTVADFTAPALTYNHSDGCAVIGGYVYHGSDIPELQGSYFFSDNCGGWVHSLKWSAGTASGQTDWPFVGGHGSVQSFGQDARGELYFVTGEGAVYRIVKHHH